VAAIYGILGDADPSELQAMGERLAHRGDEGAHWSIGPLVHLGQRRVAGRGPAIVSDLPIALDAVVENLEQLEALLKLPSGRPAPDRTAQVVLALFQNLGPDAFRQIRGAFSLAIWDQANDRLILARDLFGARSLFYARAGDRLAFASEYKALLALPDVSNAPDLRILQSINFTRTSVLDGSCLSLVLPVPSGHWLSAAGPRIEKRRYWVPEVKIAPRSDAEHVRAFRDGFLGAVRRQTACYERIGVATSGGLDGASLVAGIRHVAPGRELLTFCAGFGPEDPELIGAAETARHFRTTHHEVVLAAADLPELLSSMIWHMEEPLGRDDIALVFACAREAAVQGVEVMFGGHTADALSAGMPRHLLVHLVNRVPLMRRPLEDVFNYTRTGEEPRTLLGRLALARYFRGGNFPPPRLIGAGPPPAADAIRVAGPEPLTQYLRTALLNHAGLGHYDRLQAAYGVDMNSPFATPDVAAVVFAMPDRLKIRGRTQKYVQREALKGLLPPTIRRRGKSLARLRHDLELARVMDRLADDLLAPAALRERGIFDLGYVERLRQRPSGQPYPQERLYRLWTLVLTEFWFRTFVDRRGARPASRVLRAA
jgi:asparagine synthase (glutamine-hydrolysing)